jgi:hypothetical protein
MLFSCKISNSILTFLDRRGGDLEFLFESHDAPVELLRDPSGWLQADCMEKFLELTEKRFEHLTEDGNLLRTVGHRVPELRAWGVLDSVLKMMQRPQDVFLQPARLMSYFVSPEPPMELVSRVDEAVEWRLPVTSDQYPRVVEYLQAAFEALPEYLGQSQCQVKWEGAILKISWSEEQASLVVDERQTIKPELVQSMVRDLEKAQKDLEDRNQELAQLRTRMAELEAAIASSKNDKITEAPSLPLAAAMGQSMAAGQRRGENEASASPVLDERALEKIGRALQQVYRYNDYMVRAQQLITVLVGRERNHPQVREFIRRTDWEFVRSEYPHVAKEIVALLQSVKNREELNLETLNRKVDRAQSDFGDSSQGNLGFQGATYN